MVDMFCKMISNLGYDPILCDLNKLLLFEIAGILCCRTLECIHYVYVETFGIHCYSMTFEIPAYGTQFKSQVIAGTSILCCRTSE